ncbi:MAG: alanine dehydrogenase [Candidatus Microthrix parvicella]|jgi:alanine dehydrogenase|uniref:alanine dehydrogenase n=1 Tax=Candidatus Neomicrothrix TaxID=41949 RepID=UPI0003756EC3|nr:MULTISPECIES: alanine dehydrogenase [Microthrix]
MSNSTLPQPSDAPESRPLCVGVPTEIKNDEHRVAITPDGVRELSRHGAPVLVQAGAGAGAAIPDEAYAASGAEIVADAAEVWQRADLVCKVKEPLAEEFEHFRPGLTLFTFLHLAAYPLVADALMEHQVTGIAYETVQTSEGALPLLAPMSEVAGRMSVQVGAHFLERHHGGRGVLLGGVPGVRPARVAVLGAGNVGWNAARMAAGLGAEVDLLDKSVDRLRWVDEVRTGSITTLTSNRGQVERAVAEADLVIGAVLVPGGRAPVVVSDDMVRGMKPGAVIVDIAIDQGGCIETSHETTHENPTFEQHDVVHYAVGNMPGAVPHTSTYALTNVTLPYLAALTEHGVSRATAADPALALGVNTAGGHLTNAAVAESIGKVAVSLPETLPT